MKVTRATWPLTVLQPDFKGSSSVVHMCTKCRIYIFNQVMLKCYVSQLLYPHLILLEKTAQSFCFLNPLGPEEKPSLYYGEGGGIHYVENIGQPNPINGSLFSY